MILLLLLGAAPAVSAADSGMEIDAGVLLSYSGSASSLTIPEGVNVIAPAAFEGNKKLTSVSLPSSLSTIGDRAFYNCTALTAVSGGGKVSGVGELAFTGTPWLESSVDRYFMLGTVLLWYNGTAASVSIPTACTAIAPYAFMKCTTIESFNAYDGLLSIGAGAFYNCTKLSAVTIPSSVSYIGAYAFDGTPFLNAQGEFPVLGDGVLVKYRGSDTDVTVPENVRRIASRAFGSSKLRSVTVPSTVYSIDPYAFADCTGLEEIAMTDGLVNIGDGAFSGCKSLSWLRTPVSLGYLGQYAFSGDSGLMGAGLTGDELTVSDNAFKGCTGLEYALLSEGVSEVNDSAFSGCTALDGVSISSGVSYIAPSAFSGCDGLTVSCEAGSYAASALAAYDTVTEKGNVGGDGELNILDVTTIQRYIAFLIPFTGAQAATADINYDGVIDIYDASHIQEVLAHLR